MLNQTGEEYEEIKKEESVDFERDLKADIIRNNGDKDKPPDF